MTTFTPQISSIVLATLLGAASVVPVDAAPVFVPNGAPAAQGNVLDVAYRPRPRTGHVYHAGPRVGAVGPRVGGVNRRYAVANPAVRRGAFAVSGNRAFYGGYGGYRNWRPGYQSYNGWWFPAAAFATGAVVGGAINSGQYAGGQYAGDAHVQWCLSHYRSYNVSDNSWQPLNGPRKQCVSPYG
jgi:BA14K-like protein